MSIVVKRLGLTDYQATCNAMLSFTANRDDATLDQLWLTEHPPVYTLGLNKKGVKLPLRDDIPVVQTDRGGKITYHGPGQMIVYFLLDLKRLWDRRLLPRYSRSGTVRFHRAPPGNHSFPENF